MRWAVLLGVVAVVIACGRADPDPELATAPTVPVLEVVVAGNVATLVANVVDPEGDLAVVVVEWGDGTSDTVTSGFPGVRLDHTYTADGEFTIVLEARGDSGHSVVATTVALVTEFAEEVDDATNTTDDEPGGEGSGAGGSNSGGAGGGSTPPTPSPEPAPEEPEPEPIPEPVTVDLRDGEVEMDLETTDPDGAGGSAEAVQQGPYAFSLRTYAWHGYGGFGRADGTLERAVDATSVLADMPEHVTAVTAQVSYELDAIAELKGPGDRYSYFSASVSLFPQGPSRTIADGSAEDDDANPIERTSAVATTGTFTTTLTRDEPATTFVLHGVCQSRSGQRAFALFNEGYCDAFENGGIALRRLTVTYTPVIEDGD